MLITRTIKSENKVPSWMVTFADLMTLLLTFFVLLLSYSSLDAKKYKEASESLIQAFNPGYFIKTRQEGLVGIKLPFSSMEKTLQQETRPDTGKDKKEDDKLDTWFNKTKRSLQEGIDKDILKIEMKESGILISVKEHAAFASGSEKLQPAFIPYLRKIALIVPPGKATIVVAGHTDNKPIIAEHKLFRSNWDLSTLRATSVVHKLLSISDIPAVKIIAQGHADTKPIASNKTKKGRALNRRVEITLYPEIEKLMEKTSAPGQGGVINDAK